MKRKFSLIMATYGRKEEVKSFLEKIKYVDYDIDKIEIIIVDQNDKINLKDIIDEFSKVLNIIYIKSNKKGLSLNRNIGLEKATGEIIAFPDDDCEYLEDTLKVVNDYFENNNCDLLLGRIVERDGNDSLRVWPKELIKVTKGNFYKKCSSITMFFKTKNCNVKFNDRLGAGAFFGACEDADLIYKNIQGNVVIYNPELKIYHPHYNSDHNMSNEKVYSYGLGFGAMVKSNFDFNMFMLFGKAEAFHLLKSLLYVVTLKFEKSKKSYYAFTSRINGFIKYKDNEGK